MKNIQKQILYHSITFLVSFCLGLLFDHYVLCKNFVPDLEIEKEHEITLQKEQDQKNIQKDRTLKTEDGCTIYVDAGGALRNPGVYCLESDALVIDAVNMAGGFSREAGIKFISRKINLAQPLVNNQKLYFPYEKELICALQPLVDESIKIEEMMNKPVVELPTTEPYIDVDQNKVTPSTPTPDNSTNNNDGQCLNINTATKEQLITLKGVGESTAEKIIQGRPYSHIDDLLNVSGIGEATLAGFKADICI